MLCSPVAWWPRESGIVAGIGTMATLRTAWSPGRELKHAILDCRDGLVQFETRSGDDDGETHVESNGSDGIDNENFSTEAVTWELLRNERWDL